MAKNKIQFQQGFSLQELFSKYGTEQQCREALIQWRWPQGFRCPVCDHDQYCELTTRHLFQCNQCHAQTSVTAGTIFDSTKLPLTTWFLGIYHITQSKISVSALSLKRIIGVSYNTALLIKHKVQQTMKTRDDSKPLEDIVQLDDAYWGGKKRDGKRGRGATGKIPFVAAVSTNEDGHPIAMRFSQVATFSKAEIHSWAQQHLTPGCTVISDGLSCFKALEEAGFDHTAIITGGGPDSVNLPEFKWVNTIISNVKRSIHGCFHAISEKHFPRYLAEYCYRFNRRFDLRQMMPRFCYVALRTTPHPQRLFKDA
jgi:transposase-like protein/ribosomal protein L37AE/L43A